MSTVTQLANGSTVEKLPDGTKISTSTNGTVLKVLPDGTKIQTTKDGVELIVRPDGTKEQKNSRGVLVVTYPDGRTVQTNPDGVRIEISADKKSRLQKNADGSEILVRADGSKLQKLADGTEIEISADGKKTKKTPLSKYQTAGEAPAAPPALPPSRALPREVPASIVSSTVKTKEAELAAVSSLAEAKRQTERADRAERELDQYKKKVLELQAMLAKSEDGEAVSKAASEHAKLVVSLETEKDKLVAEKREIEQRMAKMRELVDNAEAVKTDLINKHSEALKVFEAKLVEQTKQTEIAKAEVATLHAEIANLKVLAESSEGKAMEMESNLTNLHSEKETLLAEKNSLQDEIRSLQTRVEEIINKGSTAADKLAELKFQKATAEERANRYQEEASKLRDEVAELKTRLEGGASVTVPILGVAAAATASDASSSVNAADVAKTLEGDVEILMQAKEHAEMELQMQKGELDRLQVELDTANMTINHLKEEIAMKESSSEASAFRKRAEDAEKLSITASDKIENLEKELLKTKLEKEELRLRVALGDTPASTSSSGVQTSAESSDQGASVSPVAATVAASVLEEEREKLRAARDEAFQLQNKLAEANSKVRKAELELESESKALKSRLLSLEKENNDYMEKLKGHKDGSGKSSSGKFFGFSKNSNKQQSGASETVEELRAELLDTNHDLNEKIAEVEALEAKLDKAAKEKEVELEELRIKLKAAEDQLKAKIEELEQVRPKTVSSAPNEAVVALQNEISLLQTKYELARTAKQSMEDTMKDAERRATEAEAKVAGDASVQKASELEKIIAAKQVEIESLQQNIISSERDKEAALAQIATLQATISASGSESATEIQRLRSQIALLEGEIITLKANLASASAVAAAAAATSAHVPAPVAVVAPAAVAVPAPTPAPAPVVPVVDTSSGTGTDFLSQLRAKQQVVTAAAPAPAAQSVISPKGTAPAPSFVSSVISPKGTTPAPSYLPTVGSSVPKPAATVNSFLPKPSTSTTSSYLPKPSAAPAAAAPAPAAAPAAPAAATAPAAKSNKIADMMKRFEKQ